VERLDLLRCSKLHTGPGQLSAIHSILERCGQVEDCLGEHTLLAERGFQPLIARAEVMSSAGTLLIVHFTTVVIRGDRRGPRGLGKIGYRAPKRERPICGGAMGPTGTEHA
jgi:hypothetical protein